MNARSLASLAQRLGLRVEVALCKRPLQLLHPDQRQSRCYTTLDDCKDEVGVSRPAAAPASEPLLPLPAQLRPGLASFYLCRRLRPSTRSLSRCGMGNPGIPVLPVMMLCSCTSHFDSCLSSTGILVVLFCRPEMKLSMRKRMQVRSHEANPCGCGSAAQRWCRLVQTPSPGAATSCTRPVPHRTPTDQPVSPLGTSWSGPMFAMVLLAYCRDCVLQRELRCGTQVGQRGPRRLPAAVRQAEVRCGAWRREWQAQAGIADA